MKAPSRRFVRLGAWGLAASVLLGASPKPLIQWEDLTELDWLYSLATRFSLIDTHRVHYKTPTAELAALLEARPEPEALRHLAQAQMDLGQREKALATIEKWATASSDHSMYNCSLSIHLLPSGSPFRKGSHEA